MTSSMKVVVCVARVVDTSEPLAVKSGQAALEEEGLRHVLNPADEHALEEGLRLKDRFPDSDVTAISMGPPQSESVLRRCLALGAKIPRRGLADLGLRPDEVGEAGSCAQVVDLSPPKPITKGLFIPDSSLSPEERWQQIISGGLEERHGDVIQGPPDAVAERLLQFLSQNNFV